MIRRWKVVEILPSQKRGKISANGSQSPKQTKTRRFLSTRRETPATPVFLNIYDVAADAQWLNSVFANYYAPVRFGGAFHVGLQVGSE
ncbi:unnamed protein product, partial [Symbiodinium natans]